MALTKVTYSMIEGAVVNALDYGAVADGNGTGTGTDNSAAIQAAIDAIVDSGVKGTVYIPSGVYTCNTGLVLDLSMCSIKSDGATLDFTNLVPATGGAYAAGTSASWIGAVQGVALTVITSNGASSYAGGAYYEYTQSISGLRIKGKEGLSEGGTPPAPPNDTIGIYFYGPVGETAVIGAIRSVVVTQFYHGVVFGQNAWGAKFDHCQIGFNGTCIYMPQANNAGEKNSFESCVLFNSVNGIVLENSNADSYFENTSIDGMSSIYCLINAGEVSFNGCHFEGDTTSSNMIWNNSGSSSVYSTITMNGCTLISKTGRVNGIFVFNGPTICSIHGGLVNDTNTSSSVALFTGNGISSNVTIVGGYWTSNGALFGFSGNSQTSVVGLTGLGYNGVIATDGIYTNNNKTLTIASTGVATSFGIPTNACGLLILRDVTSSGTALYNCDPGIGCTSIQNNISNVTIAYSGGGVIQATVTSAPAPRSIRWCFIRTS